MQKGDELICHLVVFPSGMHGDIIQNNDKHVYTRDY